ncbi:NAD-dependent epimerase/dehydratase family protein [Roseomonas elaeocarpi]|uniref:NAD-dependent epimerase/dehydratase family protein n=1 Tax=Roseomonas elaeocarpi TaxID=907779 RepID=A0ABV6JLV1_9PROT
MAKTVLITGALGNIGTKLRQHFESLGWPLRLVDVVNGGNPAVAVADLSVWDEAWAGLFAGVDTVIHLAGRPSPRTSWAEAVTYNIDMTQNVYEAAARSGVRRLIFASSNWVVAGHRFEDGLLTPEVEPRPVNPYGVSKLIGERLGRSYHERWGLSVVCFRIGYCQQGENRPGPHMHWGSWGQLMWLSNRDLCHAMEQAVLAEGVGFAVLNLMSNNPGMRWDIETTRRVIGYAPQDGTAPDLSDDRRADEAVASQLHSLAEAIDEITSRREW